MSYAPRSSVKYRSVKNCSRDLAVLRHFTERSRVNRSGHFRGNGFDRGENRDFRSPHAERDGEVDSVPTDVRFIP